MNIMSIHSGLGNQILNYIFVRYIEIKCETEVFIDISHCELFNEHNGFELDKIFPNIKLKLLCDLYDKEIYDKAKIKIADTKSILEGLKELGINKVLLINKKSHIRFIGNTPFSDFKKNNYIIDNLEFEKFSYIKNRYILGNYFEVHYTNAIKEQMLHELEFKLYHNMIHKILSI